MQRSELISRMKNLVNEGTIILENFPNKSHLAEKIRQVRQQYKRGNPANLPKLFGIRNLFGTRRIPSEAEWISHGLQINHQINLNREIEQCRFNFNVRLSQLESRFAQWYPSAFEVLQLAGFKELVPQLINAKSISRLDSKFRKGIAVLEKALHFLTDEDYLQKPVLIEKGHPLAGLSRVKSILQDCTPFVKIQEPYADMELLEVLEAVKMDVKISLLLGKTACPKEKFIKGLDKLKKSGRQIEAVFIVDGANAPFHDRYIFSGKKAFSLGTSMNGLGLRDSGIIPLSEWNEFEAKFNEYFTVGKRYDIE